jgi:hypothetical protein
MSTVEPKYKANDALLEINLIVNDNDLKIDTLVSSNAPTPEPLNSGKSNKYGLGSNSIKSRKSAEGMAANYAQKFKEKRLNFVF